MAALVATGLMLSACGTLVRPEASARLADAGALIFPEARMDAGELSELQAFDNEIAALFDRQTPAAVLALSGGGANGAYGAGLLIGWSERGDRPKFDIVTGVSTGALAAPFAFLGPAWDGQLRHAYTGSAATKLLSMKNFGALVRPSLFSAQGLKLLIDEHVTPQMLRAIAVEHAQGRRLLVATTNLDSQQTVIWDMGKLASHASPQAHALFKDVLLASAAIPGVFPPVLIAARTRDGVLVSEMHVDGGVNTPFLAIPEAQMLMTDVQASATPADVDHALYIVVNGRVAPNDAVTPGRIGAILGRTFDSLSKASLRAHLNATVAFAGRNGVQVHLAAIPDNVESSVLAFDQATMSDLFTLSRDRTRAGRAMRRLDQTRPALAQPFMIEEDQIPPQLRRPGIPLVPARVHEAASP